MDKKEHGKAEKAFKEMGARIDELIEDLKKVKGQAKDEFGDRIEELKKNRDTIEGEFRKVREDDRWKEVQTNLENAGKEIRKAFEAAFSKRKETESK